MPYNHTRKHNRCATPLFAVSKVRLHSVALVYMTSMVCVLCFILLMNYNRLDHLFRDVLTYQLNKFDKHVDVYMDLLKDKLHIHVNILEDRIDHCNHLTELTQSGEKGMTSEEYLTQLNQTYNKYHGGTGGITTMFFMYNPVTDMYSIPDRDSLTHGGISVIENNLLTYLSQFSQPRRGVAKDIAPTMPHLNRNVFSVISVHDKWYLATTIRYRNTHTYMMSVTDIVTPGFHNWLADPVLSAEKIGPLLYATIQDIKSGVIIHHPIFRGTTVQSLTELPKIVWTSDKGIVEYTFQNTARYMYSTHSTAVPGWMLSIVFNKSPVFQHVLYANIPNILILLLFNIGMVYMYIAKLGADQYLTQYRDEKVVCVGEGLCVMEQVKCRDRILIYRNRIKNINDLLTKKEVTHDPEESKEINLQIVKIFKDIKKDMDRDIDKLSDTGYFIAEYKKKDT